MDDFNEYVKSYLALCEHFENISKDVDFELLKKVDIFNDGINTQDEIDEIKKIIKSLRDEKTFFNEENKIYESLYIKPDKGFDYCRLIVTYNYNNEILFNYLIKIFEGILETIEKKYYIREKFLVNCRFEHFVLLKNCYISNLECLQDIITFLKEVIKPNIDSSNNKFNPIVYSDKVNNFLKKFMKNVLIEENHKIIISSVQDQQKFTDAVKKFFNDNLIAKMRMNKVDNDIIDMIEKKYINLLLSKRSFYIRMCNFIANFHKDAVQKHPLNDIYNELIALPSYQLKIDSNTQNGNPILFEEFLYSVTSIFNIFLDKISLNEIKDINILNNQSISVSSSFINQQYNLIKGVIIPFIDGEIAYFNNIPSYVSANQKLFQELQLTDYRTQQKKKYNYIDYIQEQFILIRYIFVTMTNILYTLTTARYNVEEEYRTKFLKALFNDLYYTISMIYKLSFTMYDIIIFKKNEFLEFELIENFKRFSYPLMDTSLLDNIDNWKAWVVRDISNYFKIRYSNYPDYVFFLTHGYDVMSGSAVAVSDPNTFYGITGIYYLTLNIKRLFYALIENIDTFKDKSTVFHYDSHEYNFEEFIKLYQTVYLNKIPDDARKFIEEFMRKYSDELDALYTKFIKTRERKKSEKKSSSWLEQQKPDIIISKKTLTRLSNLIDRVKLLEREVDNYQFYNQENSYFTRLHKISDYRTFKTQTDREPQDFIAQIKLKNIGGKQNVGKYKYITEDSLGKVANNNRARELANNYNQLTDKMIETEKKIGGIQKLALNDLNKSESGYIRMRGGEQQTNYYNNLIKQYQLMAIKQNNIINEIKNIKNGNY